MDIDAKQLGAAVREMRTARGMTQVELARAAGFSRSGNTIALIERGERSVSLKAMNRLATALNLPTGCLAVLASRTESDSKALARLLRSLQKLVRATVAAQESMKKSAETRRHRRRPVVAQR